MSSDGRSRRRELVEEAYNLQVKAGLMASRIPFGYSCTVTFDPSVSSPCNLLVRYRDALFFFFFKFTLLYSPIKLTHTTERSAKWRIRTRLGDFGPPYLAHFPVSQFPAQPNRFART